MRRIQALAALALLFFGTAYAVEPQTSYYLYILKLVRKDLVKTGPTDQEKSILAEHAAYHARLTREGIEIAAGPTIEDDPIGIAIFKAASPEDARAIMDNDPAVAKGVMTATLHPFKFAFGTAAPKPAPKTEH